MTKKQKRFVDEYLIDLDATQAAIRAGYSPDSACDIGCENLTKPNIKATIDRAIAERSRRTGINQDRVLLELAKVAFLNPVDVIDMDGATIRGEANRDDTACIASVKVKTIPTDDILNHLIEANASEVPDPIMWPMTGSNQDSRSVIKQAEEAYERITGFIPMP